MKGNERAGLLLIDIFHLKHTIITSVCLETVWTLTSGRRKYSCTIDNFLRLDQDGTCNKKDILSTVDNYTRVLTLIPFPSETTGNSAGNFLGNRTRVSALQVGHLFPSCLSLVETVSYLYCQEVKNCSLLRMKIFRLKIVSGQKTHNRDDEEFLLVYGAQTSCSNMPRREAILGLNIYQLSDESCSCSTIQTTESLLLMHLQPFFAW